MPHREIKKALLIAGLFVLLPSCNTSKRRNVASQTVDWRVVQARNPDVPLPVSLEPDQNFLHDAADKTVVVYTINKSTQELALYYSIEMERYGWKFVTQFQGLHTVLQFEKPQRWCTIVIERYKNQSRVALYVGPKEE